jgi:uncharacterized protein
MDVSGDYLFDTPQELVWEALQDPNVLGSVMPGGKGFEQTGENQYSGILEVKVGPVQGTFQGKITLSDIKAPESYKIEVDGTGATGFVKAIGNMRLEARGVQTFMEYSGQAQVGGRIASVGQRLMDSAARSIIRQSLVALNEYLKTKVVEKQVQQVPAPLPAAVENAPVRSAAPSPTPKIAKVEAYKPPSQITLAFNVARDVFNDLIPVRYRPWLIGAIVLIVALIVWLIVSP